MNTSFARLQTLLPERTALSVRFDLRPEALQQWMAQLPCTDTALAAQYWLDALRDINATQFKPQQRLDALEMLRNPLCTLLDTMAAQTQSDAFPMTAARQPISDAVRELERELVVGYVAVICDLCAPAGAVPFLQGGVVAMAATRAITHQGARLWNTYLAHSAPEPGVWRSLHDLFLFAASVHCDVKLIADPRGNGGKTSA